MIRTTTKNSRKLRRRRGSALVEAALVLPSVILFVMGLFEYGRWFLMIHVSSNAVAAGAAYACKHTSQIVLGGTTSNNGTSDVTNIVNATTGSQQLTNPTISVYLSDADGNPLADSAGNNPGQFTYAAAGDYVCVKMTGTYTFVPTAFLKLPSTYTPSFMAVRRSEGN
jgi:Flp pilus assembly protein TadG